MNADQEEQSLFKLLDMLSFLLSLLIAHRVGISEREHQVLNTAYLVLGNLLSKQSERKADAIRSVSLGLTTIWETS